MTYGQERIQNSPLTKVLNDYRTTKEIARSARKEIDDNGRISVDGKISNLDNTAASN